MKFVKLALLAVSGMSLAVRIVLKASGISPTTGFYQNSNLSIVFNGLLLLAIVLAVALGLMHRRRPAVIVARSRTRGVLSMVCGICVLLNSMMPFGIVAKYYSNTRVLPVAPLLYALLYLTLSLASAVGLFQSGQTLWRQSTKKQSVTLVLALPFLLLLRTIYFFILHPQVLNISDYLLQFLAFNALCVFLYAYSRLLAGFENPKTQALLVTFGWCGGLFGILAVLPQFFLPLQSTELPFLEACCLFTVSFLAFATADCAEQAQTGQA